MKLLTETTETLDIAIIEENTSGKKNYYISGIFLQANQKNKNGRLYPKEILQREVARYIVNYINPKRALGELGHPDSPTINLDRVSHLVEELKEDGNNWWGKAKLLNTPYGKIAQNLIEEGIKLGVSSRGLGSLRSQGGINYVQDDYHLSSAADLVSDPSAPDAFVRGIMESREWMFNGTDWTEIDYDIAKKAIQEAHRKDLEAVKIKLFEDFITKI